MGVSSNKKKEEEIHQQQRYQQPQQQLPVNINIYLNQNSPNNNIMVNVNENNNVVKINTINNPPPESEGAAPTSFSLSRSEEISNEKKKTNKVQYGNTFGNGNIDNNDDIKENKKNNVAQNFVPGTATFGGPENIDNNDDIKEDKKNNVAQNFVPGKATFGGPENIDNNDDIKENKKNEKIKAAQNFVPENPTTTIGNVDNNEENIVEEKKNPEKYPKNPGNVDNNSGKGNRIEESSINNEITKPQSNASSQNENRADKVDKEEEEDYEKDDLSMSRSVLLSSFQNLDLNSPSDMAQIKESVIKRVQEGYLSIFLRLDGEKSNFYYIKPTSNLKSLLKAHLELNGVTDFGEKYKFYTKGTKLDENISINRLDLSHFSVIDVFK